MARFEELLEQVREQDEGLAEELEAFKGSTLRKKAEERDAFEAENKELRQQLDEGLVVPKVEKAFKDAGVDLDALRPLEKEQLAALRPENGEPSEEWARGLAEKYQFPLGEGASVEETPPASAAVASQARTQATVTSTGTTTLTPESIQDWSTEKLMKLMEKDNEAYEALMRGETATTKAAI